jgi:hypothetical protein
MIGDNEYDRCDEYPHRKTMIDINHEMIVYNNGLMIKPTTGC